MIEDPCQTCHGDGAVRTTKRYRVNIPPGVREGSRVRLAGKGEPGRNGGPSGDLYVITHVQDNPVFKRKGDNVEVEVPLTIPEAIRGAEVEVPTLHGSKRLRVPAGHASRHGPAPPRRGPAQARRRRSRPTATSTTASSSTSRRALNTEQSEAVEKLVAGDERQPAREAVRAGPRRVVMARRRTTTTRVTVDRDRGVFMISVAAELADMHPQTLRMYETRGLIEPQRSPKGTRLYSQADVDRLRRIQEMTNELGLNLAGVERVLELEEKLDRVTRRLEALERRSREMREEMEAEVETVRRSFRAELVPYDVHRPRARAGHRAARRAASHSGATRRRRHDAARRPLSPRSAFRPAGTSPTPAARRARAARGARRARAMPVARSSSPRVVAGAVAVGLGLLLGRAAAGVARREVVRVDLVVRLRRVAGGGLVVGDEVRARQRLVLVRHRVVERVVARRRRCAARRR